MRWTLLLLVALGASCDEPAEEGHRVPLEPGEIEILVDGMGVAHVYAATDEDLFFGYGYQIAADRMYQLEMFRRRAHGRLSELHGAATLVFDNQARIFDWARWGRADAEQMRAERPERWRLIQSWVAGINRRVEDIPGLLEAIESEQSGAEVSHLDGLLVRYPDWWFNLRPSNTEPVLRLNLEANSKAEMARRRDALLARIEAG